MLLYITGSMQNKKRIHGKLTIIRICFKKSTKKCRRKIFQIYQKLFNYFQKEFPEQFDTINSINVFKFQKEIDPESCAYRYYNGLNHFRYEYDAQIKLHSMLINKLTGFLEEFLVLL